MKKLFGSALALILVITASVTLASCGETSSDNAVADNHEIHILTPASKVSLDPATSQGLPITALGLVVRRLTSWETSPTADTKVVGDLATDTGTPSADGKTWTYTLKDDIKFENGTPITSQDIKFGIERSFVAELSGGLGYHKALLEGAENYKGPFKSGDLAAIETPDTKTIIFHLNKAFGDFAFIAGSPSFSPVPVGTTDVANYSEHPVASGPYKVEEYVNGEKLVLTQNDQWSASADNLRSGKASKIVFEFKQDQNTATQRVVSDTGDDQYAFPTGFVAPSQLPKILADPTVKERLVTSKPGALEYLALNTTHKPLDNPAVRKALQYAVDKQAYRLAEGGEIAGEYASTLITPGITARKEYNLYETQPTGDPEKAKADLAAAGVTGGLTLKLISGTADSAVARAQAIQQALVKVGITVNIVQLEDEALDEAMTNDEGDYDLVISSWQPDFPSAYANIQPLFTSSEIGGGGYNLSRYSNEAVDSALAAAAQIIDPQAAAKAYQALDQQILEDSPIIPLVYSKNSYIHGSKLSNFYVPSFPAYPNYLQIYPTK